MSDKANNKRVPLTSEELEARRIARNKSSAESHKRSGYAAQKKYRAAHADKRKPSYDIKIRTPLESKAIIDGLVKRTGLTITELFVSAFDEKYHVDLRQSIDKRDK